MTTSIFDLNETVNQIINVERASLDRQIEDVDKKKKEVQNLQKIQDELDSVKNTLDTLERVATFETKSANVSDATLLSATPEIEASEITFDITVNSLGSAARTESDTTLFGSGRDGVKANLTGDTVNSGATFNPNATLNSGNINLDTGKSITAGNLVINDKTIIVSDSDTINTILTKINDTVSGITSYYDEDNDQIVIEADEFGASTTITLGADSSGFFDALKLNTGGETSTNGQDSDLLQNLNDTDLNSISAGYFTINDRTFFVDPTVDSLDNILKRINNSKADVSLFYDQTQDKVIMSSKTDGQDIVIKNDTSGFLNALNILDTADDTDGDFGNGTSTFQGTNASLTVNGSSITAEGNTLKLHGTTFNFFDTGSTTVKVESNNDVFIDSVENFVNAYNRSVKEVDKIIDDSPALKRSFQRVLISMRNLVGGSITNDGSFSNLAEVGLTFANRGGETANIQFDKTKFKENLDNDLNSVSQLFSFDSDSDGLRDDGGIANTLESFLKTYTQRSLGFIDERIEFTEQSITRRESQILDREDFFDARRENLLANFLRTQRTLQQLQAQVSKAQAIQVNFQLINGSLI